MKASLVVLLCLYCYVECRKAYAPIDKNANLAFINMEAGGGAQPPANLPPPPKPVPAPVEPTKQATQKPSQLPTPRPSTVLPPTPVKPVSPTKPALPPKPSPVQPSSSGSPAPITTPGPGSVKQLVNFYDSQGKASPIRPYSYSQAVKQG